jgi:hypothetical protein
MLVAVRARTPPRRTHETPVRVPTRIATLRLLKPQSGLAGPSFETTSPTQKHSIDDTVFPRLHGSNIRKYWLGPAPPTSEELGNSGKPPHANAASPSFSAHAHSEKTESLFHTYSQYSTMPDIPAKPTEEEKSTEAKLQELLDKVHLSRPKANASKIAHKVILEGERHRPAISSTRLGSDTHLVSSETE